MIATAPQFTANNLNEKVNGGPVKVMPYTASSVFIKVSSLVGVIAIILFPTSNLWSPAVFVAVTVKFVKSSWSENLTNIGSNTSSTIFFVPANIKCLSGNDMLIILF